MSGSVFTGLAGAASSAVAGTPLAAVGDLLGLSGWAAQLKPASFRGVPFYVDSHEQRAGRRVVGNEFPLVEAPQSEDMGRRQERYTLEVYLIGDDYFAQLSALYKACVLSADPGTLMHPYLGNIAVRCSEFIRRENKREGRIGKVALTFIEAGGQSSPITLVDTASSVLGWVKTAFQVATELYAIGVVAANHPGFILGAIESIVGGAANALLGLPANTLQGWAGMVSAIIAAPADPVATPTALTNALDTYATAVVATPSAFQNGNDPSYGLTGLATFGANLKAVPLTTPDRVQQAANQSALTLIVQASAAIATAEVYAQTTFISSNAATAARDQLTDWLDALAVAAADAGYTDMYSALTGLETSVTFDMTQRAQNLPALGTYQTGEPMPSLVLAWQFYQDPTRATQLAALNDAPHPGFMPINGVALTS